MSGIPIWSKGSLIPKPGFKVSVVGTDELVSGRLDGFKYGFYFTTITTELMREIKDWCLDTEITNYQCIVTPEDGCSCYYFFKTKSEAMLFKLTWFGVKL